MLLCMCNNGAGLYCGVGILGWESASYCVCATVALVFTMCALCTQESRARIFKLLRISGSDSKEPILPGFVACGELYTITLFLLGS